MTLSERFSRLLAAGWGVFAVAAATAQTLAPRTALVAPPDLWVRADIDRPYGDPLVFSTCPEPLDVAEQRTTLPADAAGAVTVVRRFTTVCPCTHLEVSAEQSIRILPATPLPGALAPTGCAPVFSVTPGATTLPFGAPRIQASAGAATVREEVHVLWRDACGQGKDWVVWEAVGACGDRARHAFAVETVVAPVPSSALSAASAPQVTSVDVDDFDPAAWGVGPLPVQGQRVWNGLQPVHVYRTWTGATASGGTFARVEVGCGAARILGSEAVEVTGNRPPRLRFVPEVTVACGTSPEDLPTVRARDRRMGSFAPGPDIVDLPVEESFDTLPGPCAGRFTVLRHLRAVDDAGAEVTGTQTLHVEDTTPPTFYASPAELVVTGTAWPPDAPTASAQDDCSGPVELVQADSTDCVTGRIHRITTARDGCGNAATLRQTLVPASTVPSPVLAVGCADPLALNFTGEACFETAHCLYVDAPHCVGDLDGNGVISTGDLLVLLGIFGTLCPAP